MRDLTLVLSGQTEDHLVRDLELDCLVHERLLEPLAALRFEAAAAGFELAVASSFRSFDRQCVIWNDKAAGRRPVLNDAGEPLRLDDMDEWSRVQAILRWSALPGTSRHHWGTDLDVFDRRGLSEDYPRVQLTVAECEAGGPFHDFHCWLDRTLEPGPAGGFYRPYAADRGGVAREPWHISYGPVSRQLEQALSPERLAEIISAADIALGDTVLAHLDEIYHRYVALPTPAH